MTTGSVQPDWISDESLRRLNPALVDDPQFIGELLARAQRERTELRRGTNRRAVPEVAVIERVLESAFVVRVASFETLRRKQVFLNLSVDGVRYLFSSRLLGAAGNLLELEIPPVVYRVDRRDHRRAAGADGQEVLIDLAAKGQVSARLADVSTGGLSVLVDGGAPVAPGELVHLAGDWAGSSSRSVQAEIRNVSNPVAGARWRRLGLALTHGPRGVVERLKLEQLVSSGAVGPDDSSGDRRSARVAYLNERGEPIRAFLDSCGPSRPNAFVVIPPAWGRTKESTLGLAETLLATAERAGVCLAVLRFDGTRRRGESFNDPDCKPPVGENRHYTFSRGVRDIQATLRFLADEHGAGAGSVFLVTMSIASVEARRAIVGDAEGLVGGWISLVGAVDPQSMIRVVSGGVDYFAGAAEGIRFGEQYIQGLLLDVDAATRDAFRAELAFLTDARRDMARIVVPVVWVYGADDAWTDPARVRDAISIGDTTRRLLIEAPVGHQHRGSSEALALFELAASHLVRLITGAEVIGVQPSRRLLKARRADEASRRRASEVDLRRFWREYLVGNQYDLGIEIVSSTSAYIGLMRAQLEALELEPGQRVVDAGAGAGALAAELGRRHASLSGLSIVELDLVLEGLARGRDLVRSGAGGNHNYSYVVCNLDRARGGGMVPIESGSADAVLASLLLNYVADPVALLDEFARVLRPGGRLVLSGMRPDADISKICVTGVDELRSGHLPLVTGRPNESVLDGSLQEFISSGARLLDLEEAGSFEFWARDQLCALVDRPTLKVLSIKSGYGDPPQAWVLTAVRDSERPS